jgi:lipid-A-disaccharide synthase
LRRSLIRRWRATPPDVFVGIDAPDFNFGLEKALRKSAIRTVHYVSPSIWAWRTGRIETIRKATDRVLCILPFEKKLFDAEGIDSVFVGHPKADHLATDIDADSARRMLDLEGKTVVAILPGSRKSEVARLGPIFVAAAAILARGDDQLHFVTPVATPALRPLIEQQIAAAGLQDRFRLIDGDSIEAMSAAHVVLLASGTAALESALLCKPTVAAYRIAELSARIIDIFGLIKTPYFTLPNLLTEEPLVPELIQWAATPAAVAAEVAALLGDAERQAVISSRFAKLRTELALGADQRAADAVIDIATRNEQQPPTP